MTRQFIISCGKTCIAIALLLLEIPTLLVVQLSPVEDLTKLPDPRKRRVSNSSTPSLVIISRLNQAMFSKIHKATDKTRRFLQNKATVTY